MFQPSFKVKCMQQQYAFPDGVLILLLLLWLVVYLNLFVSVFSFIFPLASVFVICCVCIDTPAKKLQGSLGMFPNMYLYLKGQHSESLTLNAGLGATFKTWLRWFTPPLCKTSLYTCAPRAPPPPLSSELAPILPCAHQNIINLAPSCH